LKTQQFYHSKNFPKRQPNLFWLPKLFQLNGVNEYKQEHNDNNYDLSLAFGKMVINLKKKIFLEDFFPLYFIEKFFFGNFQGTGRYSRCFKIY